MIRFMKVSVAAGMMALGVGCGDSATAPPPPPPPPSGALVSLTAPNANVGAVVVTMTGPDVSTIAAAAGSRYLVYSRRVNAREARVIVVGDLTAGPLFTFKLGSAHPPAAYSGAIQQVATRGDSILASTNGYQVTVSATP